MNSSEQVAKDYRDQQYRDLVQQGRPSVSGGTPLLGPVGMGNLSGWVLAAGMIGAVLGGIAGQGLVGAAMGGLAFGGALWILSFIARHTGAWDRDARPLVWLAGGAVVGALAGAIDSFLENVPFFYAVKTWTIFLGGLSWLFCWICRGAARREQ